MANTQDVLRIIGAVESFLPIMVGLIGDLRKLVAGSASRSVDDILAEADTHWQHVISNARKGLEQ